MMIDGSIGFRLFLFFVRYLSLSTGRSRSRYERGRRNDEDRRSLVVYDVAVQITSEALSLARRALCKAERHFSSLFFCHPLNTYVLRSSRNGANKFQFQNKRYRRFPLVSHTDGGKLFGGSFDSLFRTLPLSEAPHVFANVLLKRTKNYGTISLFLIASSNHRIGLSACPAFVEQGREAKGCCPSVTIGLWANSCQGIHLLRYDHEVRGEKRLTLNVS